MNRRGKGVGGETNVDKGVAPASSQNLLLSNNLICDQIIAKLMIKYTESTISYVFFNSADTLNELMEGSHKTDVQHFIFFLNDNFTKQVKKQ